MYSQNNEDNIIRKYFEENPPQKKRFLDIGANDGQTLSNTALFSEIGWAGVCIEPDVRAYSKLYEKYAQTKKVKTYHCGIATETKELAMFASGTLLKCGDIGLVSTLYGSEKKRFESQVEYETKTAQFYKWEDFCKSYNVTQDFSFISIDAEGCDFDILLQIDLANVQVLCIEWNSVMLNKLNYVAYCKDFGMKILHQNSENLIFVK